jgi:lipoate synthase
VLSRARARGLSRFVKSGFMVGMGEGDDEVYETLSDLHRAGAQVVTIGQYLRPSARHAPVARYVNPGQFSEYERMGRDLGFAFVASGPLVRSSYHAAEGFVQARLRPASTSALASERDDPGSTGRAESGGAPAHGPAVVEPSTLVRSGR